MKAVTAVWKLREVVSVMSWARTRRTATLSLSESKAKALTLNGCPQPRNGERWFNYALGYANNTV
ncbi:hypothetical protein M1D34_31280 (plasmid) [Ensifer sp. D2-11]